MNPLFDSTLEGTLGELIAQAALLAHGVQAAPPVKDSGNDLIGIRGRIFRAIQVKTSKTGRIKKPKLLVKYHILVIVHLPFEDIHHPLVQNAKVYLFKAEDVASLKHNVTKYPAALLSDSLVFDLWNDPEP